MVAWPERLTLMEDLTESTWIALDSWVGTGSTTVISVVPSGYAAYARVFHPVPSPSGFRRWSDVATATGQTMHPLAQWHRISPLCDAERRWDPPCQGEPPSEVLVPLISTLRDFTRDARRCYFAVWDGWGQLHSGSISSFRSPGQAANVATPLEDFVADREAEAKGYPRLEFEPGTGRQYLLGTGPLELVLEISDDSVFSRPGVPVAMWWPADHAWFVASEIDFDSTLVAGSPELRDALLANGQLEALEVPPDGILSVDGDTVNSPS